MPDPMDPNAIAAPDIQGGLPAGIDMGSGQPVAQSAQLQERQQAAAAPQQVPKIGAPILATFLQQMIQGPGKGTIEPGQAQPMRPPSRLDAFESFLGNFLSSFATGMGASGHGPGANERGAAAAMMAPYQQQLQQYQMGQQQQLNQAQVQAEQAKSDLARAQAEQAGQMVELPNGMRVPLALAKTLMPAQVRAEATTTAATTQAGAKTTAATTQAGAKVTAAQIQQGMLADVPKELQDQLGLPAKLPLKQLNTAESALNRPLTTVQGATDSYLFNRQTGQKTAMGVGNPRIAAQNAQAVKVADPSTPGGVIYVPKGEAMAKGLQADTSTAVKVPASVLKDFTSGASAKTLNSFNTATDHLKILSQLGDALQNGSTPLINRFGNQFATATGGAAPTTFKMAKQAVAGEIAKTFKGQATEGEISAINSVLDDAQSPAQLKGAIGTALTLMESKREALMKQYDQGVKGQPAFPRDGGGKVTAEQMLKKYAPTPR